MIIIFKEQVDNGGIIKKVQIFSILTLIISVFLQFIFNWQFFFFILKITMALIYISRASVTDFNFNPSKIEFVICNICCHLL